eukprot:5077447-Amphidinium_carterae.1
MMHDAVSSKHVPRAVHALWGQVFLSALQEVNQFGDDLVCRQLFMLPRCVLGVACRGGSKHQRRITVAI